MLEEKSNRDKLIDLIKLDLSRQIDLRMEVLEASKVHMVSPFKMNSESMSRVKPFDVILPRRYLFSMIDSRTKLSDYRVFTENENSASQRLSQILQ